MGPDDSGKCWGWCHITSLLNKEARSFDMRSHAPYISLQSVMSSSAFLAVIWINLCQLVGSQRWFSFTLNSECEHWRRLQSQSRLLCYMYFYSLDLWLFIFFFKTKCAYNTTFSLCPLESVYHITSWRCSMILEQQQV